MHVSMVLFADLMEPTLSGGSRLTLIAERCLVILQGSTSFKILIFACEEDFSPLKQITTAVLCATSDNEVEDCQTVDTWSELGHRPLETFWKLGGKAERCE